MSLFPALESGSTIALRIYNNNWFSLWLELSASSHCPIRCFDNCWVPCQGEVLQIYRMEGPGTVHSGDTVGIYYPLGKTWFSMYEGEGHKDKCPGTPNIETGFHTRQLWYKCWGEVFLVFAKGKNNGEQITAGDRLALFYPAEHSHVRFSTNQSTLSQCMLEKSGGSIQPSNRAYDECLEDSVLLTISGGCRNSKRGVPFSRQRRPAPKRSR